MKKETSFGEAITLANSKANEMGLTEEEKILRKPREMIFRLRYVGETFGAVSLTNGKVYYATDENEGMYRVIDDSGEDYLYSKVNPAPLDGSSPGGKWEMVAGESILTAFDMIEKFICGKYDPVAFSYDLPGYLAESYDEMVTENFVIAKILNEEIPDICAEYERGMEPADFINKIKEQYSMVSRIMIIDDKTHNQKNEEGLDVLDDSDIKIIEPWEDYWK